MIHLPLGVPNMRVQRHFCLICRCGSKNWVQYLESPGIWFGPQQLLHLEDPGFPAYLGSWHTWPWPGTPLLSSWLASGCKAVWPYGSASAQEQKDARFTTLRRNGTSALKFWCTWSRGMCLTSPLTTVLGAGSPTSTCSTYRVSASGCFSALMIRPTRRSRRDTSTLASSWLGVAFFFSALSPP